MQLCLVPSAVMLALMPCSILLLGLGVACWLAAAAQTRQCDLSQGQRQRVGSVWLPTSELGVNPSDCSTVHFAV